LLAGKTASVLVGVDIARSSLVRLAVDAPGILVQADAARLPFRDAAFDVVLCRHVLGHLVEDDRKAAAKEILRVLRKNGKAHFEVFSTDDARFGKGRKVEPRTFLRGDGIIHHYFEDEEARRLFGGASGITIQMRGWSERAGHARMARRSLVAEIIR
jgi:SAM-dependent methyltransferase